jgi:hypothetical protein
MNSISFDNPWLIAGVTAVLFCFNQYFGATSYIFSNIAALGLVGIILFCFINNRYRHFLPVLFFVSVFGFPEYSANPYLDNFHSPFYFAKVGSLICVFSFFRPNISVPILIYCAVVFLSTLLSFLCNAMGDLYLEIWFYGFLLMVLFNRSNLNGGKDFRIMFLWMEALFYFLVPIMLFIDKFELYDVRAGGTVVYFYGHWLGIISAISVYSIVSNSSGLLFHWTLRWIFMFVILYFCLSSFQSEHYLFLGFAVLLSLGKFIFRSKKSFLVGVVCLLAVSAIICLGFIYILNLKTNSWTYMKMYQVASLFSGTSELTNSLLIRYAEFISLIQQGGLYSWLFGYGLAGIYRPIGEIWNGVILRNTSFPSDQLSSRNFQMIHESFVMLFKWSGSFGLIFVVWKIFRKLGLEFYKFRESWLVFLFYITLFSSSLNTGLILTGLILFSAV